MIANEPMPEYAIVIGCAVGLIVTATIMLRALRTGRIGQPNSLKPVHRDTDPFGFWMSISIGAGLFIAAAAMAARWLLTH